MDVAREADLDVITVSMTSTAARDSVHLEDEDICTATSLYRARVRRLLSASSAAFLLVLLIIGRSVFAQAKDTAHQNVHIEASGMGTFYRPDYFNTGDAAYGVTGSLSIDWRFGYLRPGAEARTSYTTYPFMSQRLTSVGPRVALDAGRFHPYADWMIGYGTANFKQYTGTYRGNDSTVLSYGGGLDYAVSRFWAVRVDYQHQSWDFDAPLAPFSPQSFSLGARYMVHFRSRTGPG